MQLGNLILLLLGDVMSIVGKITDLLFRLNFKCTFSGYTLYMWGDCSGKVDSLCAGTGNRFLAVFI